MGKDARNHLLLYLNLGYALLIVYASLYPLTGWHDSGSNPLDFLGASLAPLLDRIRPGDQRHRLPALRLPLRRDAAPAPAAAGRPACLAASPGRRAQPRPGANATLPAQSRAVQPRPVLQWRRRLARRGGRRALGPPRLQRSAPRDLARPRDDNRVRRRFRRTADGSLAAGPAQSPELLLFGTGDLRARCWSCPRCCPIRRERFAHDRGHHGGGRRPAGRRPRGLRQLLLHRQSRGLLAAAAAGCSLCHQGLAPTRCLPAPTPPSSCTG
jgi:hypothetical protein